MESSIATFLKRRLAYELSPTHQIARRLLRRAAAGGEQLRARCGSSGLDGRTFCSLRLGQNGAVSNRQATIN